MLGDLASQRADQPLEPLLFQNAERAQIVDVVRHHRGIEEPQALHVADQARVIFREQGDVQGAVAARRLVKAPLIGEDGLTGTGCPLDDVDSAAEHAAVEDSVESENAGVETLQAFVVQESGSPDAPLSSPARMGSTTRNVDPLPG